MTASEPARNPGAELVEVLDEAGNVVDVVSRAQMRDGNLRHRCTYVMVVNSRNELLVHQRAHWKDVYPGYWDIAFGGVCDVGEPWDASAARELAEEAGISGVALSYLGETMYEEEDGKVLGRAYAAHTDDPPHCADGEVIATDRVRLAELESWLAGRLVSHDSVAVLLPFLADGLGGVS